MEREGFFIVESSIVDMVIPFIIIATTTLLLYINMNDLFGGMVGLTIGVSICKYAGIVPDWVLILSVIGLIVLAFKKLNDEQNISPLQNGEGGPF